MSKTRKTPATVDGDVPCAKDKTIVVEITQEDDLLWIRLNFLSIIVTLLLLGLVIHMLRQFMLRFNTLTEELDIVFDQVNFLYVRFKTI